MGIAESAEHIQKEVRTFLKPVNKLNWFVKLLILYFAWKVLYGKQDD